MENLNCFAPPFLAAGLLLRPRIIECITAGLRTSRWVYIAAPGGYGKSVAAAQSLQYSGNGRHAWLALNQDDNDPVVFYRRFVRALIEARSRKKISPEVLAIQSVETLLAWLQTLASNRHKSILVLDNLHNLTNHELLIILPLLLENLPKGIGIILISREAVRDILFSAIQCERLKLVNRDDLSFTRAEIETYYLENHVKLTRLELNRIHKQTGGWAISLKAGLLSKGKNLFQALSSSKNVLKQYLDDHIWPQWDAATHDFLLKSSVKAELVPELCDKLSGRRDSAFLLQNLLHQGAFLTRTTAEIYRFHDLFREYLKTRLQAEVDTLEIDRLYLTLAEWEEKSGDYYRALHHYVQLKHVEGINRCSYKINDFNSNVAVESDLQFFQAHLAGKVDDDFILNNPYLLAMRPWVSFLEGDATGFLNWLDRLNRKAPEFSEEYPDVMETSAFLGSLDFRVSLKDIAVFVAAQIENLPSQFLSFGSDDKKARTSSLTQNLPLFHRSMRDYSEFHLLLEADLLLLKNSFGVLIGPEYEALELCVPAGILYEQGTLRKACRYALTAFESAANHQSGPETVFATQMLLATIFDAMDCPNQADLLMEEAAASIKAANADYLYGNLRAIVTQRKIRKGDKAVAMEWLTYFASDLYDAPGKPLGFYRFTRHFTTLRALFEMERWKDAIAFAKRLRHLAETYMRPLDVLEAEVLLVMALSKAGQGQEAHETLAHALGLAYPYNYRQVFLNEKPWVEPLLHRVIHDNEIVEEIRGFAESLGIHADKLSGEELTSAGIRLSRQQMVVLKQLILPGSYTDIAKRIGLKKSSVKTHLVRLYKALGVNSREGALHKAKLLGLVDV
ncbi:LuxR C-terminal-related transcriptional regulator [Desulfosarcina sp. OttesenSCG-928-G17]|nr:LuxR C-terminal-related transcriptional regulator [Desulfosarcina sp. OttesenSCG-928-G17]